MVVIASILFASIAMYVAGEVLQRRDKKQKLHEACLHEAFGEPTEFHRHLCRDGIKIDAIVDEGRFVGQQMSYFDKATQQWVMMPRSKANTEQ